MHVRVLYLGSPLTACRLYNLVLLITSPARYQDLRNKSYPFPDLMA